MTAALFLAGTAIADPVPGPAVCRLRRMGEVGRPVQPARLSDGFRSRRRRLSSGTTAQADEAWTEVLTLSPDADIPGMREQFMCHWQYAELAYPDKTSWNLEPWRPRGVRRRDGRGAL